MDGLTRLERAADRGSELVASDNATSTTASASFNRDCALYKEPIADESCQRKLYLLFDAVLVLLSGADRCHDVEVSATEHHTDGDDVID